MSTNASANGQQDQMERTPLYDVHVELGAKMTPFAGYSMPVQFPSGIITEHTHTREAAGLFDVSHMGQAWLRGDDVAARLETLVPGELQALKPGRIRYTQLLTDDGGIIDDLMVTKFEDDSGAEVLFLVVNGACKHGDFAHIEERLAGRSAELERLPDRALMALQGPKAVDVVSALSPETADMAFMSCRQLAVDGHDIMISRCGYTGEDGFEISVAADTAAAFAQRLLGADTVAPVGLGARDSLRLEAGLCLYGNDIDAGTSPIEANLSWSIGKRRREEGGFPGADRVQNELQNGPSRVLVGVRPEGRAPARQGTGIHDAGGTQIGTVTSGSFGPSFGGPVAMGYVQTASAEEGADVILMVRGKENPAKIAPLPFVPHRYYRGKPG